MYRVNYDHLEKFKQVSRQMGSNANALWSNDAFKYVPSFLPSYFAAWGRVTERAFSKTSEKPEWKFDKTSTNLEVSYTTVFESPFCNLLKFSSKLNTRPKNKILLIAPMSGHYATLVKKTVYSLVDENEVFVTDWINPRDIPLKEGKFDIEDYISLLVAFYRILSPKLHVFAVCQPAPLSLVATALVYKKQPEIIPLSLTLLGGPIAPDAAPTAVSNFSKHIDDDVIRFNLSAEVSDKFQGCGRQVYPGIFQLSSFMSMNAKNHISSFSKQIFNEVRGKKNEINKHNKFYDEYLAVMDMTREFFSTTIKCIYNEKQIEKNTFFFHGEQVDLTIIDKTPIFVIEGENDDIAAPGQCSAVFSVLKNLNSELKNHHIQIDAGHYGIFSGKVWENNIKPKFLNFMRESNEKNF